MKVPGIAARTERRVFGGRPHRKLIEIRLAEKKIVLGTQFRDDRRIVRRNEMLQDAGGAGRRHTLGTEVVLNGQGHAGQGLGLAPSFKLRVQLGCLLENRVLRL